MKEYIEREAILEPLKRWNLDLTLHYGARDEYVTCLNEVIESIELTPAADVREVVRGKWLEYDDTEYFRAICSLCGNWIDTRLGTNYCPNCGARMEKDGDA